MSDERIKDLENRITELEEKLSKFDATLEKIQSVAANMHEQGEKFKAMGAHILETAKKII